MYALNPQQTASVEIPHVIAAHLTACQTVKLSPNTGSVQCLGPWHPNSLISGCLEVIISQNLAVSAILVTSIYSLTTNHDIDHSKTLMPLPPSLHTHTRIHTLQWSESCSRSLRVRLEWTLSVLPVESAFFIW